MKQINVRLQDSDYDLIAKYAAEWGITPIGIHAPPSAEPGCRLAYAPRAGAKRNGAGLSRLSRW